MTYAVWVSVYNLPLAACPGPCKCQEPLACMCIFLWHEIKVSNLSWISELEGSTGKSSSLWTVAALPLFYTPQTGQLRPGEVQ